MKRQALSAFFPLILLLLSFEHTSYGALSKHMASYDISARLDVKNKAIEGHETLTWLNDSRDEIRELWLHLYMNAFKNEKSTFMRESRGLSRGVKFKEEDWGWIDVKKMQMANGADLTQAIEFVHPDDDNEDDQTVIKVALPQPVAPGGSIQLHIEFYTKLPRVFARTGYHQDFFFAGQWFPKIGVYEKAGDRYAKKGQWNCHQYHASSEFYANYGKYRVHITVPSRFVVGASGVLQNSIENKQEGTITYTYYQEDIHDFAWTAQPQFKKVERDFIAHREVDRREIEEAAKLLDLSEEEVKPKDVRMILLIQPEHESQIERHFQALKNAIKYFSLWYGKYPYDTITLVDPPWGAQGAGGMEYPTLITAGTRWLVSKDVQEPEGVIVHEFGHQFWYGLVANNEFEEAWLDEGFNTYSTDRILDKVYGPSRAPINLLHIPLTWFFKTTRAGWDAINRSLYLGSPKADNLVRNAWEFYDANSYGRNSYARTGLVLRTLENYLGEKTMAKIMRTHHQRWRFKHPTSYDFIQVVNEVSGKDMSWFFNQLVFSSNVVDYRVANVSSKPVKVKKGVYDQNGEKLTITEENAEDLEEQEGEEGEEDVYESEVVIRREGEAIFPVEIEIVFEDGEVVQKNWDGEYRWVKYHFIRPAKVKVVQVDPENKILLDVNFSNNSYKTEADHRTALKWSSRLMFWLQHLLQIITALS